MPGEPLNSSGVDDPKLTEMIKLQRRTFDDKRSGARSSTTSSATPRSRFTTAYGPSVSAVGAWMPYVKNFGPNIGHDYGGRLIVAWLDQ